MFAINSGTRLIIGLAASGMVLITAGARLYRRRQAGETANGLREPLRIGVGAGNEDRSPALGHMPDEGPTMHTNIPQGNKLLPFFVPFELLNASFMAKLKI